MMNPHAGNHFCDEYSVCSSLVESPRLTPPPSVVEYDVADDFFDTFETESDMENCEVLSTGTEIRDGNTATETREMDITAKFLHRFSG